MLLLFQAKNNVHLLGRFFEERILEKNTIVPRLNHVYNGHSIGMVFVKKVELLYMRKKNVDCQKVLHYTLQSFPCVCE